MKLHALTLTWNGADKLEKLQPKLLTNFSHLKNIDCEWHIRDNGSKDNTKDVLFKSNNIHLYEVGHNRSSFAKGVNYLFEKANPADNDLILLLNNDVVFGDQSSLLKMYSLMRSTGAAVVGAKLIYTDSHKLQHAGVIFGKQYGGMPWHYRRGEVPDEAASRARYFQAVTAAVCLVKASSFRRIGGMDENFRWAFEDIDMCLSIGEKEKIAYCGDTKIYHEESASLNKNPVNKMFLNHNVQHFKNKWSGKYVMDHQNYLSNTNYNAI